MGHDRHTPADRENEWRRSVRLARPGSPAHRRRLAPPRPQSPSAIQPPRRLNGHGWALTIDHPSSSMRIGYDPSSSPLNQQTRNPQSLILKHPLSVSLGTVLVPTPNRLETIPGVGFVTASALASFVPDPEVFRSGRHFAAWLGLVPRQNSSGGKTRLGRISKQGNRYIRQLLILGATSVLRYVRRDGDGGSSWIGGLLRRQPPKVVAVALAKKMARIA